MVISPSFQHRCNFERPLNEWLLFEDYLYSSWEQFCSSPSLEISTVFFTLTTVAPSPSSCDPNTCTWQLTHSYDDRTATGGQGIPLLQPSDEQKSMGKPDSLNNRVTRFTSHLITAARKDWLLPKAEQSNGVSLSAKELPSLAASAIWVHALTLDSLTSGKKRRKRFLFSVSFLEEKKQPHSQWTPASRLNESCVRELPRLNAWLPHPPSADPFGPPTGITGGLSLVGDDAPHEMRVGGLEVGHQLVEREGGRREGERKRREREGTEGGRREEGRKEKGGERRNRGREKRGRKEGERRRERRNRGRERRGKEDRGEMEGGREEGRREERWREGRKGDGGREGRKEGRKEGERRRRGTGTGREKCSLCFSLQAPINQYLAFTCMDFNSQNSPASTQSSDNPAVNKAPKPQLWALVRSEALTFALMGGGDCPQPQGSTPAPPQFLSQLTGEFWELKSTQAKSDLEPALLTPGVPISRSLSSWILCPSRRLRLGEEEKVDGGRPVQDYVSSAQAQGGPQQQKIRPTGPQHWKLVSKEPPSLTLNAGHSIIPERHSCRLSKRSSDGSFCSVSRSRPTGRCRRFQASHGIILSFRFPSQSHPPRCQPGEERGQELQGRLLEEGHHSLVERVLVLLQPPVDVVVHGASIVDQGKMRLRFPLGVAGFSKVGRFAQVVVVELGLEGHIAGFGEHAFFFQDGHDAQRLTPKDGPWWCRLLNTWNLTQAACNYFFGSINLLDRDSHDLDQGWSCDWVGVTNSMSLMLRDTLPASTRPSPPQWLELSSPQEKELAKQLAHRSTSLRTRSLGFPSRGKACGSARLATGTWRLSGLRWSSQFQAMMQSHWNEALRLFATNGASLQPSPKAPCQEDEADSKLEFLPPSDPHKKTLKREDSLHNTNVHCTYPAQGL
ncbi:DEAD-box ATP-dependent RNA helicase 42, partial [Ophiophagus hannah]